MNYINKLASFDVFLKQRVNDIEEKSILEVLHYSLIDGGKRIRPQIYICLCNDLKILPYNEIGFCIECFHCASLMHDDLPAIDNDDQRRGKLSTHKAFGESLTILVGDYLPVFGLEVVSSNEHIPKNVLIELCKAYKNLCVGQIFDVQQNEEREKIQKYKTGALFKALFLSAYESLDISVKNISGLRDDFEKASENFGALFQQVDDFLDVFAHNDVTGKQQGSSDKRKNKNTLFVNEERFTSALLEPLQNEYQRYLTEIHSMEMKLGFELLEVRKKSQEIFSRGGLIFSAAEVNFSV